MLAGLSMRVRALFHADQVERELTDELRFHVEQQADKFVNAGMPREEALRRARLSFGGIEQVKEECRDARGLSWLEGFWRDSRYAVRMFRNNPTFSAIAVLTLALGIGANTAIFSVIDGVLLKPLPYPHPEQLVGVELSPRALDPNVRGIAPEDYFIFREQSRTFQDIGIYLETDADRDVNVTSFAEPERVHALHVTGSVLSLLGVSPAMGRTFSAADGTPSAAPTTVLTYKYWQQKFSGDRTVIGRTLIVDGVAHEVIGVLPRDFRFLDDQEFGLILPLQLDRNKVTLGDFRYFGIGRLKEGVSVPQASADIDRMVPITFASFPAGPSLSVDELRKARLSASILPLKQEVVGDVATLLWVLMGGVGMVLLIACANVANLLLVRMVGRRHELALRRALGASRSRVVLQLLCESAILGLLGGAAGLGLAWAAVRVVVTVAPAGLPRVADIGISLPTLLFALGMALLTAMLVGLIPLLKDNALDEGMVMNSRTQTASRKHRRVQGSLVGLQVALAVVLLVCSGLMVRTFRALTRVNPGFTAAGAQVFRVSIPPADLPDDASVPRIEQQIQDKLASIPAVSSVAFGTAAPLDGNTASLDNVFAADHPNEQGSLPPLRRTLFVSPGYPRTLGIPLIAGRDFDWAEIYNKVPVALVSENLAREYWGTAAAAIGQRIRPSTSPEWREIIGVVGDVHDEGMYKPAPATVYWPTLIAKSKGSLRVSRYVTFIVRSPRAGSEAFLQQVRGAVWSVNGKLPLARLATLSQLYARSMARTSFTLVMLGIAALIALLLGTVGLYGVIAYSVSQRSREIGVRMALGAQPREILALIMRRGMSIVATGLAAGLLAALLLTRLLASLLYGIRPGDPLTYGIVVLLLLAVALGACYVPALRATRIEPMIALRYE